jgi:hypothetical protein
MMVKDLQEFLSKFTEANALGTRQGNAISNAVIFVEGDDGKLREIRRMEVHEHSAPIIGHTGHTAHRLVMKTTKVANLWVPEKLKDDY